MMMQNEDLLWESKAGDEAAGSSENNKGPSWKK